MKSPYTPRLRLGLVWLGVLAAATAALAIWLGWPSQPATQPLDGKLMVFVRPPERAVEPLPIEEPGALPVRSGGIMSLQVQLNEPAFTYLVWLDSEGQVLPLYPWNPKSLDVKDINEPPPLRRSARVIYSPLLGGGWTFGSRGGAETVLLLARRTPLPEGTQVGALLGSLPAATKTPHPQDVVIMGLDGAAKEISTLFTKSSGTNEEAQRATEPLRAMLVRLQPHFELIRAVQFANEGG